MKTSRIAFLIAALMTVINVEAQKPVLEGESLESQFEYVKTQSSRWENYTMIPDPLFEQLKKCTSDTLIARHNKIDSLIQTIAQKNADMAAIENKLAATQDELQQTIKERNSFTVFGINMSKGAFLSVTGFILIGLLVVAAAAALLFQKENMASKKIRKDQEQLKQEFEDYRQESRKRQEQLVIQHHKEIQKLKGMG
jgi:flagellar motility protein MotE (MotC chaperone)